MVCPSQPTHMQESFQVVLLGSIIVGWYNFSSTNKNEHKVIVRILLLKLNILVKSNLRIVHTISHHGALNTLEEPFLGVYAEFSTTI